MRWQNLCPLCLWNACSPQYTFFYLSMHRFIHRCISDIESTYLDFEWWTFSCLKPDLILVSGPVVSNQTLKASSFSVFIDISAIELFSILKYLSNTQFRNSILMIPWCASQFVVQISLIQMASETNILNSFIQNNYTGFIHKRQWYWIHSSETIILD